MEAEMKKMDVKKERTLTHKMIMLMKRYQYKSEKKEQHKHTKRK